MSQAGSGNDSVRDEIGASLSKILGGKPAQRGDDAVQPAGKPAASAQVDREPIGAKAADADSSAQTPGDRSRPEIEAAVSTPDVAGSGQTLEDMIKDTLRPVLEEWLDRHLPVLVERIVDREIVKLAARR